ncbi:MAG: sigma-70 family RNA polymerase sigma factor [Pseudomonadota bacterium]
MELSQLAAPDLVSRIASGDTRAEHELVARYSATLLTVLRKRCGSLEQAEDARQDALLVVLQRLRGDGIDDPNKLTAFIHKTAINILIGDQRKAKRRNTTPSTDIVETTTDDGMNQLHAIIREESRSAIRDVVQEINNDRDREIIFRFYIKDQGKFEICKVLELSATHFDRVISRARSRFRGYIESKRPDLVELLKSWEPS